MNETPEQDRRDVNPFAAPQEPAAASTPSTVAGWLGVFFGVLGLGTWSIADRHGFIALDAGTPGWIDSIVTAVFYCLPMAIVAVVLGVRGSHRRLSAIARLLGVIGILGVPGAIAYVLLTR